MTGFFMLSGYALQMTYNDKDLMKKSNVDLFYRKRFVSIYPLYIITGTLFVLMMIIFGQQDVVPNLKLLPVELLGIQSFFTGSLFEYSHNGGTWFISCLFVGYFVFPYAKQLVHNQTKRLKYILAFFALLLSYSPFVETEFNGGSLYTNPFFRLMEFLSGVVIAKMHIEGVVSLTNMRSKMFLLIAVILIMIGGISIFHFFHWEYGWITVCSFVAIFLCMKGLDGIDDKHKVLIYLSKISYAFFLAQFFVWGPMKFLIRMNIYNFSNLEKICLSFILCSVVSAVLHEVVEVRLGNLIKSRVLT